MSGSRVSCSEYSFPSIPGQFERISLVRLLGFESVDVALFLADGADLAANPTATAANIRTALKINELMSGDLFMAIGATFEDMAPNQRDAQLRQRGRLEFGAAVRVASDVGIAGLTILPGVTWAEDPETSWSVCVDELAWRVEEASTLGLEVRIEPHVGSIVPTPERVIQLCAEVPGLRLTLDLSHFELQNVGLDRVLTLVPLAGHLHIRAAKPGAIQVRWRDNETNFAALLESLRSVRYQGGFCVEYVPMERWRCDELDVVTEALATRAALVTLGIS